MVGNALDGATDGEADALMHAAREICPCASATRGNIRVRGVAEGSAVTAH